MVDTAPAILAEPLGTTGTEFVVPTGPGLGVTVEEETYVGWPRRATTPDRGGAEMDGDAYRRPCSRPTGSDVRWAIEFEIE